jgi:hypothetical protein
MSDSDSNDETMQDEYNKRMDQSRESKCEDPIEYWQCGIANAIAMIACFALEVPAMSSEPEWVFSVL